MNLIIERLDRKLKGYQDSKTIVIWGAGLLGNQIEDYIQHQFPQHTIIGVVDLSITIANPSTHRYPINGLAQLQSDLVIVASVAYENEIVDQYKSQYANENSEIISFSADETYFGHVAHSYSENELKEAIFNYPESYVLWEELANRASEPADKAAYLSCAQALR